MTTSLQRISVIGVLALVLLGTLSQCIWFKGDTGLDQAIVNTHPIGGYEALGSRIYYPPADSEAGNEGSVMIRAFVSDEGIVTDSRVTEKLDADLDQIALNAVRRTRFEPALKGSEPVEVWISIPIVFALKSWQPGKSPFSEFEMVVRPDQSYQTFDVEMQGQLNPDQEVPLHFEYLLPFNAQKPWVKTETGDAVPANTIRDENGEWLIFDVSDPTLILGYNYRPVSGQLTQKFQYKFIMNQALPKWQVAVIYDAQHVNSDLSSGRVLEQADGSFRVEYDMESLEAYEPRYLEIEIIE